MLFYLSTFFKRTVALVLCFFIGSHAFSSDAPSADPLSKKALSKDPQSTDRHSTDNEALQKVHQQILKRFNEINHLSAKTLKAMDPQELLIFDVREYEEFNVSRIKDAIWIDPSMKADDFFNQYREQITNKTTLVFYCSVGMRSSTLARRIQSQQSKQLQSSASPIMSAKIYNLANGIFGWHNQALPLFRNNKKTDAVHPYSHYWKELLNRQEKTSYTAVEASPL